MPESEPSRARLAIDSLRPQPFRPEAINAEDSILVDLLLMAAAFGRSSGRGKCDAVDGLPFWSAE